MRPYLLEFKDTGDDIVDKYRKAADGYVSASAYILDVTDITRDRLTEDFKRVYIAVVGNNKSVFKIEIDNRGFLFFENIGDVGIHFLATVQTEILSGILLACSYIEDIERQNQETAPEEYFQSAFLNKYLLRKLDIDGEDYAYTEFQNVIEKAIEEYSL